MLSRIVDKALEYTSDRYRGQRDDQGRPYFFAHTVQVYGILKDVTDDEEVLAAGILHDILEDSDTTYEDLIHEFNRPIADLVMELTQEESEEGGHYFPRLESKKAVLIKFADRLSNLSRMGDWPGDRARAKAPQETASAPPTPRKRHGSHPQIECSFYSGSQ